jgi:hypothetical protein
VTIYLMAKNFALHVSWGGGEAGEALERSSHRHIPICCSAGLRRETQCPGMFPEGAFISQPLAYSLEKLSLLGSVATFVVCEIRELRSNDLILQFSSPAGFECLHTWFGDCTYISRCPLQGRIRSHRKLKILYQIVEGENDNGGEHGDCRAKEP